MQTLSTDENSVRPSVLRPSVCLSVKRVQNCSISSSSSLFAWQYQIVIGGGRPLKR